MTAAPARWPAYPACKPSGLPWLGDIPEHWPTRRLKFVAPASTEKLKEKPTDAVYLGLEHIESGTGRLLLDAPVESVDSSVIVFHKGDVLFGKLRPYLAKVICAEFNGVGTSELLVLRPVSEAHDRFLFYLLLSTGFINLIDSMTYGTKMPRASSEQVGDVAVPLPPLPEQRAIAAFLDHETAKIDTLIAKKERLIDLLDEKRAALISRAVTKGLDPAVPMKDSGVEWLGEIPRKWEVKRLKFLAEVRSGTAKGRDFGDRDTVELPYLRVANVQDGYLDLSDVATITIGRNEIKRYSLRVGDVLMNEGGDFDKLGRGSVWHGQIELCVHQNHVFAVRPYSIEDSHWINTITFTDYGKHYFILKSKQSTNLASISASNLENLPILMPPSTERRQILEFVNRETANLQSLISRVQDGSERLREYRAALIAAAVTGKIRV
jgi:type I restriction enzyme S subunit